MGEYSLKQSLGLRGELDPNGTTKQRKACRLYMSYGQYLNKQFAQSSKDNYFIKDVLQADLFGILSGCPVKEQFLSGGGLITRNKLLLCRCAKTKERYKQQMKP